LGAYDAEFTEEAVHLEVAIIAFKSTHFNNRSLFQIVQSELFIFKLVHVLDDSSESVDQVDDVVAFVEDDVDILAGFFVFG
jgi:hypothetical protein